MATTIKSTSLDFDAIKNNLKTFLAEKDEFADYNFEASGLSNILDVLAYNTHYNGLTANFALNESFLGTAQLRSSLVSLAEGIGYIPDSKTSSQAIINMSVNLSGVTGRPANVQLNEGFKFNATVDETEYVFQTLEDLTAADNGEGLYIFKDASGSTNIKVYEGTERVKTFLVSRKEDNAVYIIPDKSIDIDTAVVRVYETPTSSAFSTYTNLLKATTISSASTLYILKESPNGFYELSFGNGTTLGRAPDAGNKVTVTYLASSGSESDTAKTFEAQTGINVVGTNYPVSVTTVSNAVGGGEKESIESIRSTAPFQYASQNRMVTAVDYSTLVLRNFSTLIKDIQSFGGEDALEPKFGTVFMSILFNADVDQTTEDVTKQSIIDLASQLSVASFNIEFTDPIKTFVETQLFFQFNPNLTTLSRNTIQDNVNQTIRDYFSVNTGKFNQSFRRSNLLTLIDDVSPAILSSRAEVRIQRRFSPTLTKIEDHTMRYAAQIAEPDDVHYVISSTAFNFRNKTCTLRNKLNSNKLEIFNVDDREVIVDNVGSFTGDTVSIVGLQIDNFVGADSFIKVSAKPANESAVTPFRQDVIEHDDGQSFSRIVEVEPGVTN
tara:strand:- start:9989 stop:11815 length:1827 start_codon:yes stop_codon:yes gene_type:complete